MCAVVSRIALCLGVYALSLQAWGDVEASLCLARAAVYALAPMAMT